MLRLWGHKNSSNVQKVLWALDELRLDFERVDAGGPFGRVKEADYLTLNPNGLVPTLEDGPLVVWESHAIVRYLFARYGSPPLQPSDLADRARADAWTDWQFGTLWPPVRTLLVQLLRTPEERRDQGAIDAARKAALAALGILDRELSRHPWAAGEYFTFADIPLGVAAQRWYNLPIDRPALQHVDAWYGRIKRRPGFERWVDLPLS
ncbi:glutathione S-transferase family protein [Sorangium sp. So ce1128]